MHLLSTATAAPPHSFTQQQCAQAMHEAAFWPDLNSRSQWVIDKVLTGESGIHKRHFALQHLHEAWGRDAQEMNNAYEREAPTLAAQAVADAVAQAGLQLAEVDAVFLCSCTGYLCPGVTSYLAEQLGLREDVFLQDMTGLGCGAAVPLIRAAKGLVADHPEFKVVTVAVEICSAAFYVEDDFGVLISTCIFGDGAAAAVWSGSGGEWQVGDFRSLHVPQEREKIRFTNAQGKLRNQLDRSVPQLAAATVQRLYDLRHPSRPVPQAFITHGGGRDVIEALEAQLTDLPPEGLRYARAVMQDYGNMSSPSVLFALHDYLGGADAAAQTHLWMCAFGAGFSAHSCEMVKG